MSRRLTVIAAILVALGTLVAGCGSKRDTITQGAAQPVTLMLDYLPNADHVGIYTAKAQGDFGAVGLNVDLRTPSDPAAPLKLLAAGKVDLAISYEPELLLARDKGLHLVSVGALVQRPLTSIMAVGSKNIRTPADLAGKTVGTAGIPYQTAYLKTITSHAGVTRPPREVGVGFNLVPAMLSGKVDATLGAYWNIEGIDLARHGKRPSIIPVDKAGVPTYDELIIVARQSDAEHRGSMIRRFMQALARGYDTARRNPVAATNALVKANPSLDHAETLQQVRASLPVFFPADGSKPFGYQDPAQWVAFGRWMRANHLLTQSLSVEDAQTDEFLAGQGI